MSLNKLKKYTPNWSVFFNTTGDVLLSQAAARQVSSALKSLTTVFEMGTGVTSSLLSPDLLLVIFAQYCVILSFTFAYVCPYTCTHAHFDIPCLAQS